MKKKKKKQRVVATAMLTFWGKHMGWQEDLQVDVSFRKTEWAGLGSLPRFQQ